MSNFNITAPNVGTSAISLGGEWRNHDHMEANKYKMSGLQNRTKMKKKGKVGGSNDQSRPRSEPGSQERRNSSSPINQAPASSAPPGIKPRCDRVYDLDHEPAGRKSLDSHLPLKKTRAGLREEQSGHQYRLGPGMVLTKGRSKVAVTIHMDEEAENPRTIPRAASQGSSLDPAQ